MGTYTITGLTEAELGMIRNALADRRNEHTARVMAGFDGMLGTPQHAQHLADAPPEFKRLAATANGAHARAMHATYVPDPDEVSLAAARDAQAAAIADAVLAGDDDALADALAAETDR